MAAARPLRLRLRLRHDQAVGSDLTHLDAGDKALLTNKRLIAIDQDGIPAVRVVKSGNEQVFAKRISAVPTSGTGGTGELVGAQSGKCIDADGGNVYFNGTKEQLWDCNGGVNQEFSLTDSGQLRTMGATDCLDVYNDNTTPGTKVELWNCDGGDAQKWTVKSDGTIVAQKSGLCLDATGAKTADGAPLQLWTCNGDANQKWSWSYH
ncbi:RICIN domain-containing protein [Streptomyces sp. NBC_00448]|uniref:RICIN domain-containing protein n=1 Tax=Streptomyces sp. NBC_00448 TaxID=2903652 RepID=UPI002E1FA3AC